LLIRSHLAAVAEQEWLAAVVQEPEKPDPSERFRLRLKIQLVKEREGHLYKLSERYLRCTQQSASANAREEIS
jgi:hypothetical protein